MTLTYVDGDQRTMDKGLFYPNPHVALQKRVGGTPQNPLSQCKRRQHTLVANPSNCYYLINYETKFQKPSVCLCCCEEIPQTSAIQFLYVTLGNFVGKQNTDTETK